MVYLKIVGVLAVSHVLPSPSEEDKINILSCNFTLHESKHMMLLHDSTKVQNRE